MRYVTVCDDPEGLIKQSKDNAEYQGWQAYRDAKDVTANPYLVVPYLRAAWKNGWQLAQSAHRARGVS